MKIDELKKILKNHEERLLKLEGLFQSKALPKGKGNNIGVEELTKKIDVSEEKIKELFDFEKDSLTVLAPLEKIGENDKEKIKNITLLTLIGYKYFFGKDETLSQEVRRNIEENGVPTNNFATYLGEISPSLIRRKGKMRSPKTVYRITVLGDSVGRGLIKKLCGE